VPTIGPDREIVARKEHCCDLCGLRIRRRARYWMREGVEGRVHWRLRMHAVCRANTDEWTDQDWEEWRPGDEADFRRHVLELRDWRRAY
jgi:hypothetical protein